MAEKEKHTGRKITGILLGLIGIALVLYFVLFKERAEFNSDYTDTLVWAQAALKGNGIFSSDFIYAYLLPFGGNLIMMPFVAYLGVTYEAQAFGMAAFAMLFLLTAYLFFRACGIERAESFGYMGLFGALLCVSQTTRMIFYGHVIHYSLGLLFTFVALALVSKLLKGTVSPVWAILLFVWSFLCMNNGFSAALFFMIPVLGAIIVWRFTDTDTKLFSVENKGAFVAVLTMLAGGVCGFASYLYLGQYVNKSYENYFSTLEKSTDWIWDPADLIRCFVTMCTGELKDSIPMMSTQGINIVLLIAFACFIMIIPIFALVSYKKYENPMMKLEVLTHWILVLATLFVYNISPLSGTDWRLCGIFGSAVVTTILYASWLISGQRTRKHDAIEETETYKGRYGCLILLFLLAVLALITLREYKLPGYVGANRYDRLIEVLNGENLDLGYGQFWSANVTTILSDSNVVIRPIEFHDDGTIAIDYYQTDLSWYSEKSATGRYFIFASADEYLKLKDTYCEEADEIIEFDENGYILVFDHELFR